MTVSSRCQVLPVQIRVRSPDTDLADQYSPHQAEDVILSSHLGERSGRRSDPLRLVLLQCL